MQKGLAFRERQNVFRTFFLIEFTNSELLNGKEADKKRTESMQKELACTVRDRIHGTIYERLLR